MAQYANFPPGHILDFGRVASSVTVRESNGTVYSTVSLATCDSLQRWTENAGNLVTLSSNTRSFVVLFTDPITITGAVNGLYFTAGNVHLEYSSDSTNGADGTWTSAYSRPATELDGVYGRGDRFAVLNLPNVTGIRTRCDAGINGYQKYFMLWTTDLQEGLNPWHPTNDEPLSNDQFALDRGNIYVNASPVTQQFRIKNSNPAATATNVTVAVDSNKGFGSLGTETQFSLDDSTYSSSVSAGTLAPGAISPLIYMRRPLITDPVGTTRAAIVKASPASWD